MDPTPAGTRSTYERQARHFADIRARYLPEGRLLEDFARRLQGRTVLDIGCGPGVAARHLCRQGCAVTGVDVSRAMVVICRQGRPPLVAVRADMQHLRLGRRFHGLVAWDSLFHLPALRQPAALRRLAAHARPGALLLMSLFPVRAVAIGWMGDERIYTASLSPHEMRRELRRAGFSVVRLVRDDPALRRTWLMARRSAAA
jgi:2-polyprenyl-3-methyl-5-hydroxy-6-metoxy-1,4-benzoquinol methylase